jgi:hypothetical protein
LIVVDQLAALGECVETGKQVIVMGTGAPVQDNYRLSISDPAFEDAHFPNVADPSRCRFSHHRKR